MCKWIVLKIHVLFVEDKPGLFEELGTDISELNNGIIQVKPR